MSFCIFHELELQINNSSYSLLFFKTFFSMLIYFGLFFQFFFTWHLDLDHAVEEGSEDSE